MNLLSTVRKKKLEEEKLREQHKSGICPKTGKPFNLIDRGWLNVRPFMLFEHIENHRSECDCYLNSETWRLL